MLAFSRGDSKYIEEYELFQIIQQCGMPPELGRDILINLGIVKPYRPGVYMLQK